MEKRVRVDKTVKMPQNAKTLNVKWKRVSSEEQGNIGQFLYNIYSGKCVCKSRCTHVPTREYLAFMGVCVRPNRFSLCHFQALPPLQPQGYLCLPAVCYLKEAVKKHKNLQEMHAHRQHTSHRIENQCFSHLSFSLSRLLLELFFQQPKHSKYQLATEEPSFGSVLAPRLCFITALSTFQLALRLPVKSQASTSCEREMGQIIEYERV